MVLSYKLSLVSSEYYWEASESSHQPTIPILSFSWSDLKTTGNSTSVARQCHLTADISCVVSEERGRERARIVKGLHLNSKHGQGRRRRMQREALATICTTDSISKKITSGSHPGSSRLTAVLRVTGLKSTQSLYLASPSPHPSCSG